MSSSSSSVVFGDPRTREIKEPNPDYKCCFCGRHETNPAEWGELLELDGIVTHYFCVLFSSNGEQNGSDDEGVHGFLPEDILKEVRRGKRIGCKFCKRKPATIGCVKPKCPQSFHYTCGYENGCLNQFFGLYQSYCPKHKPRQTIPTNTRRECPICFTDVEEVDEGIWPPCCGKQLFHRRCIMHAAKSAGYFFKCPLCNSKDELFLHAMKANGVYVPEQDAAWELEANAFQELAVNYSNCDANVCQCTFGRSFNSKGKLTEDWDIVRCRTCGHSAIHMKCGNLSIHSWKCPGCVAIIQEPEEQANVTITLSPRMRQDSSSSSNDEDNFCHDDETERAKELDNGISKTRNNEKQQNTLEHNVTRPLPCLNKVEQISDDDESLGNQYPLVARNDNHKSEPITVIRKPRKSPTCVASSPQHTEQLQNGNVSDDNGVRNAREVYDATFPELKMEESGNEIRLSTVAMLKKMGVPTRDEVLNFPPIPKLSRSQRVYEDIAESLNKRTASLPNKCKQEKSEKFQNPRRGHGRRATSHAKSTVKCEIPVTTTSNDEEKLVEETTPVLEQPKSPAPKLLRNPFANLSGRGLRGIQQRLYNIAYGTGTGTATEIHRTKNTLNSTPASSSTKPVPPPVLSQLPNPIVNERRVIETIDLVDSSDEEENEDIVIEKVIQRPNQDSSNSNHSAKHLTGSITNNGYAPNPFSNPKMNGDELRKDNQQVSKIDLGVPRNPGSITSNGYAPNPFSNPKMDGEEFRKENQQVSHVDLGVPRNPRKTTNQIQNGFVEGYCDGDNNSGNSAHSSTTGTFGGSMSAFNIYPNPHSDEYKSKLREKLEQETKRRRME